MSKEWILSVLERLSVAKPTFEILRFVILLFCGSLSQLGEVSHKKDNRQSGFQPVVAAFQPNATFRVGLSRRHQFANTCESSKRTSRRARSSSDK